MMADARQLPTGGNQDSARSWKRGRGKPFEGLAPNGPDKQLARYLCIYRTLSRTEQRALCPQNRRRPAGREHQTAGTGFPIPPRQAIDHGPNRIFLGPLERQMLFVAAHFNLILMVAGLCEIVGRLQAQPVFGMGPTGFL
jgi:hypothetical protein